MILTVDDREVRQMFADLDAALGPELNAAALQIAQDADAMVLRALDRGVYLTPEGEYDRTGRLADGVSVRARPVPAGGTLIVLENTAPYAAHIEYGTLDGFGKAGVSLDDLPRYRSGQATAPYFGRTGAGEWWQPQPHIRPAALWTGWKLERHIVGAIAAASR